MRGHIYVECTTWEEWHDLRHALGRASITPEEYYALPVVVHLNDELMWWGWQDTCEGVHPYDWYQQSGFPTGTLVSYKDLKT